MTSERELSLDTDADAVTRARHFTDEALAGVPVAVVADTGLVVTELVTNALLHGRPPVTVRVSTHDAVVRVEVHDQEHRPPVPMGGSREAMTGRGLALVAALSSAWGIEEDAEGKLVWAEIPMDGDGAGAAHVNGNAPETPQRVDPTYTIELGDVPTELLLEAKAHVDNLVRELVLGWSSQSDAQPAWLSTLVQSVAHDFAGIRTQIKAQAFASAARDAATTHLVLRVPASAAAAGERYLAALDEAGNRARDTQLLTLDAPPEHSVFRHWYVEELAHQLHQLVAGEAPDPVPAFTPEQD